ncbi:MAG: serine hydrolase [Bacilli bacterium]
MKIILFILLFLTCNTLKAQSSYIVMDGESGRVLEEENMNDRSLIASTTKIMTSIIAIENAKLTDKYTVNSEIDEVDGSMIYAKKGETFTLEELLYGLNLVSGNDAANIIANNVKPYQEFINLMNKKARQINMKNTIFNNPHGLDEKTQNYSCAYDLALLMRYAMNNKTFAQITSTRKYKVKTDLSTYIWYNKNKLLSSYKFTTGGKLGYTPSSGHLLVSSASKSNKKLIIVTLKKPDQFNYHKALYEKTFKEYSSYKILDKSNFVINNKKYRNYRVYIKNDVNIMLSKKDNIKINYVFYKKPIKNNIGHINIIINNKLFLREKIYKSNKTINTLNARKLLYFWK